MSWNKFPDNPPPKAGEYLVLVRNGLHERHVTMAKWDGLRWRTYKEVVGWLPKA